MAKTQTRKALSTQACTSPDSQSPTRYIYVFSCSLLLSSSQFNDSHFKFAIFLDHSSLLTIRSCLLTYLFVGSFFVSSGSSTPNQIINSKRLASSFVLFLVGKKFIFID